MIRQAIPSDAPSVIPLMLEAIGSIAFILTGVTEEEGAARILGHFFRQEGNRVSHQNTLVLEDAGQIVGLVLTYDGAKARELDRPLETAAAEKSTNPDYLIPTEPDESEFYLDTVIVSSSCRGKGYGTKLIEEACRRGQEQGHQCIALLVEVDNSAAIRLYQRLGFKTDRVKRIGAEDYCHMVRRL